MSFKSINPYNQEVLNEFPALSDREIAAKISLAETAFENWKKTRYSQRRERLMRLGELLEERADAYAQTITLEMGKTLAEAKGEVLKCTTLCEFYAREGEAFLQPESVPTEMYKSY
ncbi:MAG: aldehyde dehydrogenase family protein, partial [Bacteroidota bacterium]